MFKHYSAATSKHLLIFLYWASFKLSIFFSTYYGFHQWLFPSVVVTHIFHIYWCNWITLLITETCSKSPKKLSEVMDWLLLICVKSLLKHFSDMLTFVQRVTGVVILKAGWSKQKLFHDVWFETFMKFTAGYLFTPWLGFVNWIISTFWIFYWTTSGRDSTLSHSM